MNIEVLLVMVAIFAAYHAGLLFGHLDARHARERKKAAS